MWVTPGGLETLALGFAVPRYRVKLRLILSYTLYFIKASYRAFNT